MNSIRNKLESLQNFIENNIDILLLSGRKLESFSPAQFTINGCSKPYRLDRTSQGGDIMMYVRHDIPSKIISTSFPPHIECFFVEINFRRKKWLLCCSYNPPKSCIENHLECLSKELDLKSVNYENLVIFGDFNSEQSEDCMKHYCGIYNLHSLISIPTCFKNPENPTCIDIILINRPKCFQCSTILATVISDCHKLTVTMLKETFQKQKATIISYRNYKKNC